MSNGFPHLAGCLAWFGALAVAIIAATITAVPVKLIGFSDFAAGMVGGHASCLVWVGYFIITERSSSPKGEN